MDAANVKTTYSTTRAPGHLSRASNHFDAARLSPELGRARVSIFGKEPRIVFLNERKNSKTFLRKDVFET